jgi:hypothetical protein
MSGFSIDWLDLREDADRRARDSELQKQAVQWLEAAEEDHPVVVDLGAGTGSTLRALSDPEPMALTWRLVDHNSRLLQEARRRHGKQHRIESCPMDLTHLSSLPLDGARLVTASALIDLVSAQFLETLAAALRDRSRDEPVGIYAALNYDGTTRWSPSHPLDDAVLEAFNQDQRREKGLGPALGPDAGARLQQAFTRAGFRVRSASSPWELGVDDHELVSALIDGIAGAVAHHSGIDAASLEDWIRFRQEHARSGSCMVGHTDVLALPA